MNDSEDKNEEWIDGDYIAAVIDDLGEVEAALGDLGQHGFSGEDMRVYSGRAGSEDLSQLGGEGLLGTIRRALEDYGGAAKDLTDRLEAETARGRHVIIVPLVDAEQVDTVRRTLLEHGAHDMMGRIGGFYKGWVEGGYAAA
jgi:hypothetical protein